MLRQNPCPALAAHININRAVADRTNTRTSAPSNSFRRYSLEQVDELFRRLDPDVEPYKQEDLSSFQTQAMPSENQVFRWWLDHKRDGRQWGQWFCRDRRSFVEIFWRNEMQVRSK